MQMGGVEFEGSGAPWSLKPSEIEAWAKTAPVGGRLVYAHGPSVPSLAGRIARGLYESGLVVLNLTRSDDGLFDYLATRRQAPRASRKERPPISVGEAQKLPGAIDRLLSALTGCAEAKQLCPSSSALVDLADLRDVNQVNYLLDTLARRGSIALATSGRHRVVIITSSGKRTAHPRDIAEAKV